ncbi:hypothetical protein J6590_054268 [Homalodisca vitripennis]|nr:hypothetical protein J6590_054268 [Homalodisca vitripennis]
MARVGSPEWFAASEQIIVSYFIDLHLRDDFRTTTNSRAGGLLARTESHSGTLDYGSFSEGSIIKDGTQEPIQAAATLLDSAISR